MYAIQDISAMCKGIILQHGKESVPIQFLLTDSRKVYVPNQSLFIALVTEARNAHQYIADVYARGVRSFLIQEKIDTTAYPAASFILVQDTLRALQLLAATHRDQYNIPVIGITGSNGKTIVKEWLSELLLDEEVVKNPRSYNSQLGVPLSVWNIGKQHTIGLFEAGISQANEMHYLANIIKPTIGIFTMIGAAHDQGFDNTEHKIAEKLKLFKDSKILVYCKDDAKIDSAVQQQFIHGELALFTWGFHAKATLQIKDIASHHHATTVQAQYKNQLLSLTIPFSDKAYVDNAMSCWLSLLALGKKHESFASKFLQLPVVSMRLELKDGINNCTLINDSYSADTASLRIALDFLSQQQQHKKKSLILSDILQHKNTAALYEAVVTICSTYFLDKIILIGDELAHHKTLFDTLTSHTYFYKDTDSFLQHFDQEQFQNEAILIKGARRFAFERIVNRLEDKIHQTELSINLSALIHNINVYKKRLKPTTKIMAMVKAFSYGSGSYEIANVLQHHGIDYLAVAYADEGIELRRNGIELPILVLNPTVNSLAAMMHYRLEPEIYSIELLQSFIDILQGTKEVLTIHIKLDTGMHRLGIESKDMDQFLSLLVTHIELFHVQSIFSHLVGSDDTALDDFTKQQAQSFDQMAHQIEHALGYSAIKHLSNSTGASRHGELQYDMVRLGLGLYGLSSDEMLRTELQQISTLKASISQIKDINAGDTVGYSRAGKLKEATRIATINIGYADGYSRAFSQGKGKVLINGCLAPVIGNVCMDMIMVNINGLDNVRVGDEVIIFGEELSVTTLAQWSNTIPYEIITSISQRVKRVYYRD